MISCVCFPADEGHALSLNDKEIRFRMFDVGYFFTGFDVEIVIENEVNVVRKEFFTRGLLTHGMQRAFAHL